MSILPKASDPLFDRFRVASARPRGEAVVLLAIGATLAMSRRKTSHG